MSLKWGGGTWPGSLSTCVNGHVFIEIDIFEVDASAIKSHLYYKKKKKRKPNCQDLHYTKLNLFPKSGNSNSIIRSHIAKAWVSHIMH